MSAKKSIVNMNGKPLEGEVIDKGDDVRPTTEYNLTTIADLLTAFQNSYNITEACHYAGISRDTYYRWLEQHPELAEKVEQAKHMPTRKAKETITKAIKEGDVATSRWLLERRDPDFRSKGELEVKNPDTIKTKEKIRGFLNDTDDIDAEGADASSTEPSESASGEAGAEVAGTTPPIS